MWQIRPLCSTCHNPHMPNKPHLIWVPLHAARNHTHTHTQNELLIAHVQQFSHSVWPFNYWSSPAPVALLSHNCILNSWLSYTCSISRINEGDSSEAVSTARAEKIFLYLKNRETLAYTDVHICHSHSLLIISRQLKLLPAACATSTCILQGFIFY